MAEENFDPFGAPKRPAVRTTDDYLREREQKGESLSHFFIVAFCRNSTSALRSSGEPIFCSGILVPGV